jgi:putative zinc finger protein
VSDHNGELAKLFARLDAEGHGMEEHPPSERLSAFEAHELPPAEHAAVQKHLETCTFCRERLDDLERFLVGPGEDLPAPGVVDFEAAAEWRRLRDQLRQKDRIGASPSFRRFFSSARGGYGVAAASLALAVALAAWDVALVRKSHEPAITRTTMTLIPKGSARGSSPTAPEPVFLPAQITLSLEIEPDEATAHPYRIEILPKGSQRSRWTLSGFSQGADLNFTLPKGSLAPGSYVVRVSPLRQGARTLEVWSYDLEIAESKP